MIAGRSQNGGVVASMEDPLATGGADKKSAASLLILAGIWLTTQFAGIFSPPLLDDMDALHVEAAREMVARHDYVTLYVDGIRYLDKPPLPYWLGALSIHIFGIHDWAVRLPLALSVLVLTFYLYAFGSRLWGERAGFYAGCAFATCIGPYLFTRFFIPDVIVALWMTVAADLILRMIASAKQFGRARIWEVGTFAIVITLGLLTKGLVGLVFPVGVLVAYLACIRQLRLLTRMRLLLGSTVMLVTALPWHILATIENPSSGASRGWFWFYFVNEQINRYLNKRIPRDYDKVPLFEFWLLLFVWLMPWGVYLVSAAWTWWRRRKPVQESPQLLCLVWGLLILVFFSFSTRQEYYTLPAVPALALLTGRFLSREEEETFRIPALLAAGVLCAVGLITGAACGYFGLSAHQPLSSAGLYQAITEQPHYYARSMGHVHDLTMASLAFFRGPLLGTAIAMLTGTVLTFWLRIRRRYYFANILMAFAMCGFLNCAHAAFETFYPILGSEPLAAAINMHFQASDKIVIDGQYSDASSIGFYTGQPLYMLNGRVNNLWYGSLFADSPHRFEDDASFQQLWNSKARVFFVTTRQVMEQKLSINGHAWKVAQLADKILLTNHPLPNGRASD